MRKFNTQSENKMEQFRNRVEQVVKEKDGTKAVGLANELMK